MSRNRVAILADIEQFNLDPNSPHRGTHANGRLAKAPMSVGDEKVDSPVVDKAPESVSTHAEEPVNTQPDPVLEEQRPSDPETSVADEPKSETVAKKKGKKQATE